MFPPRRLQESREGDTGQRQAGCRAAAAAAAGRPLTRRRPAAMEVWCRSRIPVEGNFGQTYESLNQSVRELDGEFSATIDLRVGGGGCGLGGGREGRGHAGGCPGRAGRGVGAERGSCQLTRAPGSSTRPTGVRGPWGGPGAAVAPSAASVRPPPPQEEKQAAVLGVDASAERVSTALREHVRRQEAQLLRGLRLLRLLLSCTFLLVLRA